MAPTERDAPAGGRRTLWLHIGHGKTGTTALQRYARQRSDTDGALHYTAIGRASADTHLALFPPLRKPQPGAKTPIKSLIAALSGGDSQAQFSLFDSLIRELHTTPADRALLLSAEQLVFFRPSVIAEICSRLSDFDLRILYYVRRQDELIESTFRWMQVSRPGRFADLDTMLRDPNGSFDFEKRLAPWRACLPDSAFALRLYHAETCARDIAADLDFVLGLPPMADLLARRRERPSLDAAMTRVLMSYNSLHPNCPQRGAFVEALRAAQEDVGAPRGRPFLSPEQRLNVLQRYADSNRRIAERFLSPDHARLFMAPGGDNGTRHSAA